MKFCPTCGIEMEQRPYILRGNSIETKTLADEMKQELPCPVALFTCPKCNHREVERQPV